MFGGWAAARLPTNVKPLLVAMAPATVPARILRSFGSGLSVTTTPAVLNVVFAIVIVQAVVEFVLMVVGVHAFVSGTVDVPRTTVIGKRSFPSFGLVNSR